jgi:hypothetical protein
MEFKGYTYKVSAEVKFTKQETELLVELAKGHYDGACKLAGCAIGADGARENGFIAQLVLFPSKLPIVWAFREFDLTMKVLEQRRYLNDTEKRKIVDGLAERIGDVMEGIGSEAARLNS